MINQNQVQKINVTPKSGVTSTSLNLIGIPGINVPNINQKFIFDNKDKLLDGNLSLIQSENDFTNLEISLLDTSKLNVNFDIVANKTYDKDGKINPNPQSITLTISGFKELNQETFVSTLKEEFSKFLTPKIFATPENQAINLGSQEINKQNQARALRENMRLVLLKY